VSKPDKHGAIDPILLTGIVTDAKREFGVFFTPPDLARRAAKLADLRAGMRVLEPSAGHGALVLAARAEADVQVDAIELYPGSAVVMKSIDLGGGRLWGEVDFLAASPGDIGRFDRVLMNPPFAKMADARHVLHAVNFLDEGGHLVAIMSAAVTFRETTDYQIVRSLASHNGGAIEALPPGSFKKSGTDVNAALVTINRQ
jgi:predicted RNA methylase